MVLQNEERFEHLGSAEMVVSMIDGAFDVYLRNLTPNEQHEIMEDIGKVIIKNVSRKNLLKMMEVWL
jgi:hypothetical protein